MIPMFLMQVLAIFVLPTAAVALIVLGISGRRDPTRPLCGTCGAALRFAHVDAAAPCDSCGARASDVPPRPARRRPWIGGLVGGIACAAAAVAIVLGSVMWISSVSAASTSSFSSVPNSVLLSTAITSQFPTREIDELRRRLAHGSLQLAEVKSALASPSALSAIPARGALSVAAIALEADPKDEELAKRTLETCFPPAKFLAEFLATRSPYLLFDPTSEPHVDVPLARLAVVRSITIDGKSLSLEQALGHPIDRPTCLPLALAPVAPGPHELEVELELFLFERFDAERCRGAQGRMLPEADWPRPLGRSMLTVRSSFTTPK
ncbi:MAG: hypothetical protein U0572_10430 [Phycisphaerales bacterium]